MSVKVENLEHNMAKLTIEMPAEELEKALQAAYLKQRGSLSVPGFRKGKVPRQILEKMYGPEIFYEEAANSLISQGYEKAYGECGLDIVSRPEINVEQIKKGEPFVFTAEIAVKPEVTLGAYKGMEVEKVSTRVTQKEVDAELELERERNARLVDVTDRPVADQDQVILDFEGFVDGVPFEGGKGENHPLTIGSGSFIPGFEEQLIGAEPEQVREVKVTFPADYHVPDLAGKDAVFTCTVHAIKTKELPELDDEFASEVSEFETLEEYKADIKNKLKERKAAEGRKKKEEQAIDKALEQAQMDIPQAMIDTQASQMLDDFAMRIRQQGLSLEQYLQYTGSTPERMLEELKPQAEKQIKVRLLLEAIVKAEEIQVGDELVEKEFEKIAEAYKMELEKVKEFMSDSETERIRQDLAVQQAVDLLIDTAVEA